MAEYRLLNININDAEDKITKIKEDKSKNKTAWRSQAVCLTENGKSPADEKSSAGQMFRF